MLKRWALSILLAGCLTQPAIAAPDIVANNTTTTNLTVLGNTNLLGTINAPNLRINLSNIGNLTVGGVLTVNGTIKAPSATIGAITATTIVGSGAGITNLNASYLTSGTIPWARIGPMTGGDLTGSLPAPEVVDNSHNHSQISVTGFLLSTAAVPSALIDSSTTTIALNLKRDKAVAITSADVDASVLIATTPAGGDATGTLANLQIVNDSHNHSAVSITDFTTSTGSTLEIANATTTVPTFMYASTGTWSAEQYFSSAAFNTLCLSGICNTSWPSSGSGSGNVYTAGGTPGYLAIFSVGISTVAASTYTYENENGLNISSNVYAVSFNGYVPPQYVDLSSVTIALGGYLTNTAAIPGSLLDLSTYSFVLTTDSPTISGQWTFSQDIITSITGNAATVTNGVYTNQSYSNPAWITYISPDKLDLSTGTPNSRNINTTAPLAGGGDLSADRTISISSAGPTSDGYLKTADWNTFNGKLDTAAIPPYLVDLSTIPTAIALATTTAITDLLASSPTASGTWTFTNPISASVTGNAGSVTNGVYTNQSYANPAWITSLDAAKLTGTVPGAALDLSTYPFGSGGNAYTTGGVVGRVAKYSDISTMTASSFITEYSSGVVVSTRMALGSISTLNADSIFHIQASTSTSYYAFTLSTGSNSDYQVSMSTNGTVQALNISHNEGVLYPVIITDAGSSSINLSTTSVLIRSRDDWNNGLFFKDVPALNGLALTNNSINFIYVDWNGGSPIYKATTNRDLINNSNYIPIARVYVNNTVSEYQKEYGNVGRSVGIRLFDFTIRTQGNTGMVRESGLNIACSTTVPTITSGFIWFGVDRIAIEPFTGVTDKMEVYTHAGGNWIENDVTGIVNSYYDNGTSTVALTANRYAVNWIWERAKAGTKEIDITVGRGDYTLGQAIAEQVPATPDNITYFYVLVGKIIIQKGATIPYSVESPFTTKFTGSVVSAHSDLTGLTTGDDHTQYAYLAGRGGQSFADNIHVDGTIKSSSTITTLTQMNSATSYSTGISSASAFNLNSAGYATKARWQSSGGNFFRSYNTKQEWVTDISTGAGAIEYFRNDNYPVNYGANLSHTVTQWDVLHSSGTTPGLYELMTFDWNTGNMCLGTSFTSNCGGKLGVRGNINVDTGYGYLINGASLNTANTLTNVAYKNQANTFTGDIGVLTSAAVTVINSANAATTGYGSVQATNNSGAIGFMNVYGSAYGTAAMRQFVDFGNTSATGGINIVLANPTGRINFTDAGRTAKAYMDIGTNSFTVVGGVVSSTMSTTSTATFAALAVTGEAAFTSTSTARFSSDVSVAGLINGIHSSAILTSTNTTVARTNAANTFSINTNTGYTNIFDNPNTGDNTFSKVQLKAGSTANSSLAQYVEGHFLYPGVTALEANGTGGLALYAGHASGRINFYTKGAPLIANLKLSIEPDGAVTTVSSFTALGAILGSDVSASGNITSNSGSIIASAGNLSAVSGEMASKTAQTTSTSTFASTAGTGMSVGANTAPTMKLDLWCGAECYGLPDGTSGTKGFMRFRASGGYSTIGMDFGVNASAPHGGWIQARDIGSGYGPLLLNPIGGKVGVNNSNPTEPLHVSGNIKTDYGIVAATGSFSSDVLVSGVLDIGLDFAETTCAASAGVDTCTSATCASGKKVISGGCRFESPGVFAESRPASDFSVWYCRSSVANAEMRASRVCARVK